MRLRHSSLPWLGVLAVWLGCVPMASAQLVTSTLTSTGNWNDPIRWDTDPLFPNNGNGGNNYNVNIGAVRTATLTDVDITIEGLVFNTGTINGNRNLTMNAASTWSAGTIGGTGTIQFNDALAVNTNAGKTLSNPNFRTAGTTTWTGTGTINGVSGSTWTNLAGALFDAQNNSNTTTSGGPSFFNNNAGATFRKSVGTGTTNVNWQFNNSGTIDVQTGTLVLSGGGTSTDGTFVIATGAVLNLTTAYTFSGTQTGTGGGEFRQNNNINVAASGATLNFVDGLYRWNSGSFTGGTITHAATSFITLGTAGAKSLTDDFENNGTIRHAGTGNLTGSTMTFNNNSGALYDLQSDIVMAVSGSATFNNLAGATYRKSGGTGTSTIAWGFNNSGTIEGNAGILSFNGAFSQTPTGTLSVDSGTIRFGATGAAVVNLQGAMVGNGTIDPGTINHSNGAIAPGLSVGTLTIAGNLALAATSVLNFELGTSSDLLIVNGNLTLDGVLNVTDSGGFAPGVYTLIDYSGTLTDNGLNLGSLPGEFAYAIVNDPINTRIQLVVTSVPEPAALGFFGMLVTGGFAVWARRREEQQLRRFAA